MLGINKIHCGDCIEHMKQMPENCVDAIITDPPYGLEFMGKDWDKFKEGKNIAGGTTGKNTPFGRSKPLNSVYQYTNEQKYQMQNFFLEFGKEAIRVLKHGGFLLMFGGTRTYHRLVCGIENAGFEIRDTIMWLYGSGFPKSLDIGKDFDRQECRKQLTNKLGRKPTKEEFKKVWKNFRKGIIKKGMATRPNVFEFTDRPIKSEYEDGLPVSENAKEWEGWGTALKPACEPICVARKPLSEKNVALNVLKWGTGGININECRIEHNEEVKETNRKERQSETWKEGSGFKNENNNLASANPQGRFPANIILDEESGRILDEQSGVTSSKGGQSYSKTSMIYGEYSNDRTIKGCGFGDKGGASRFFYCAKASKGERNLGCEEFESKLRSENNKIMGNPEGFKTGSGNERNGLNKNNHPTVKPIALMEYLIKLVTRENAIVLDTFIGSGTTAIACIKLNRKFIGIEKEEEYVKIAKARINHFSKQKKLEVI